MRDDVAYHDRTASPRPGVAAAAAASTALVLTATSQSRPLTSIDVRVSSALFLSPEVTDGLTSRSNCTLLKHLEPAMSVWTSEPPGFERRRRGTASRRHPCGRAKGLTARRGPPLRGELWLDHNGPSDQLSAHWGSVLVQNGRTTVPQRFAIDFIGLDSTGRGGRGDVRQSSNCEWVRFGADVLP
jgi:hypothetical protein